MGWSTGVCPHWQDPPQKWINIYQNGKPCRCIVMTYLKTYLKINQCHYWNRYVSNYGTSFAHVAFSSFLIWSLDSCCFVFVKFHVTPWRNGSASDSRSEGCVFESRRGQAKSIFYWSNFFASLCFPDLFHSKVASVFKSNHVLFNAVSRPCEMCFHAERTFWLEVNFTSST